ncbi:MAG: HEAT repeat domain-containing protein [Deltaproteobacteria bacterium]|nr:HEAT repeat domain-containing protein [Deltaproteobacteria bacterium]
MTSPATTSHPSDSPPPSRLAWRVTPAGLALITTLVYFGVLSGLWTLFRRDTFQNYFDGYVRASSETVRRRYRAKFQQSAPHDSDGRLLAILEAPDSTQAERLAATELLGRSGATDILPVLIRLEQQSQEPQIRLASIMAMGSVPSHEARAELARLLASEDRESRIAALKAIRMHRRQDLGDSLRERLTAPTADERLAAVAAASVTGGLESRLLGVFRYDPDPAVRLAAAGSLRELPRHGVIQTLAAAGDGWVPVQPDLPRRRVNHIQRMLEGSFLFSIEDALSQLQEGDPDLDCEAEACRAERDFYRDLLRRRSSARMDIIGFQKGRQSLYFVTGTWLTGNVNRYAVLAMVHGAGERDAAFTIRETPIGMLGRGGPAPGNRPALGQVLSVTGTLRDDSIRVEILEPDGRLATYSFRNGVFHNVAADPPANGGTTVP